MAYTKVNWTNGATALSAENLNHMDIGIDEAHTLIAELVSQGIADAILARHPIGSIEMNTTGTNPATYLGGTWEAWGQGRVPVGVGTSDRAFAANESGGASTVTLTAAQSGVPAHSHGVGSIVAKLINHVHTMAHTHSVSGNTGDSGSHSHGTGSDSYTKWVTTNSSESLTNEAFNSLSGSTFKAPKVQSAYGFSTRTATAAAGTHHHPVSLTTAGSSAANTGNPTSLGNCTMSGSTANNTAANASAAHNNLQPYITCFMFKRIA